MLGSVCTKKKIAYVAINTGFVGTVGYVCSSHLAFSIVLMLPELVVAESASVVGNRVLRHFYLCSVIPLKQS